MNEYNNQQGGYNSNMYQQQGGYNSDMYQQHGEYNPNAYQQQNGYNANMYGNGYGSNMNQIGNGNMMYNSPQVNPGLGIASLCCGVVSLIFLCIFWPFSVLVAIAGIISGGMGIAKESGKGMAIAGLVCSIVCLVFIIFCLLFYASILFKFNTWY